MSTFKTNLPLNQVPFRRLPIFNTRGLRRLTTLICYP